MNFKSPSPTAVLEVCAKNCLRVLLIIQSSLRYVRSVAHAEVCRYPASRTIHPPIAVLVHHPQAHSPTVTHTGADHNKLPSACVTLAK